MTKNRFYRLLKSLFLLSLLNACAPIPPNVDLCISLSENNGACFKTITEEQTNYEGPAWEDLKKHSLVMPADSWAKLKEYILEACKEFKNCEQLQKKIEKLTLK